MTREIEYTYIYICPVCKIERFSTETPQEYSLQTREDVCMNCDNKGRFEYVGSVGKKKKRYLLFKIKLAFWNFIKKFRRKNGKG